jgi:NTE family protein
MAHAGILSILDRAKIPISAIAGTSMGAIVAAAYAFSPVFDLGLFSRQMIEMAGDLPSRFRSEPEGDYSFLDRVRLLVDVERFLLETIWGWGFLPPTRAVEVLDKITMGKDLREARLPTAVVAVDLNSGEKVVFREGPASRAVQASASIPGFIPPVQDGKRLLADGGVVDVVPADVVRTMGVDVVIAVDVDDDEYAADVHNGLEAFLRAIDLSARDHKRCLLRLADLIIDPRFGEPVGTLDISKLDLCIEAGLRAGERALPAIRGLMATRAEESGERMVSQPHRSYLPMAMSGDPPSFPGSGPAT